MPAAALGIAVSHPGGEAPLGIIAFPPFAGLKADIAALGQQLGERWCAADVPQHLAAVGSFGWVVAGDQMLVRIEARDNRHQARSAEAGWRVAASEDYALPGQPIEMRRL